MSNLLSIITSKKTIFSNFRTIYAHSRSTHRAVLHAGNREQVGYGINGNPTYIDRPDYPFPAVRWKEPTPELCCLWEKEKGDWSKLTREEKKQLYRASFRQTYKEFKAPSCEWKFPLAMLFWSFAVAMWIFYLVQIFVNPVLPDTFCPEKRAAQLRRILDLQVNPIEGISSRWDYEKNTWKK